jgi:hypothetical protein
VVWEAYKLNQTVMVEPVKVARDWLREQIKKEWKSTDDVLRSLFARYHCFITNLTLPDTIVFGYILYLMLWTFKTYVV